MRIIEACGVDAIFFHPRFFEDKFKRHARHEHLEWVASQTHLPVIANGDLIDRASLETAAPYLRHAGGRMFGRILAVQPWFFAALNTTVAIDYDEVWQRLFAYTMEDFAEEEALDRMKLFSTYYARTFQFGHTFANLLAHTTTTGEMRRKAAEFLRYDPHLVRTPSLQGF